MNPFSHLWYTSVKGGGKLEKFNELKKYKFYLTFKGGNHLVFETNTDIRKARREVVNGGIFVDTENEYTINLAQVKSLHVKIQK